VPGVVVITPVPAVYEMTDAPERDELEILLLKLVQLAEVRQPNVEALAVSQVMLLTALVSPVEKVNGFS